MNNRNIKIKKLLVVALAAVLVAVCISSTTFSWFDRPGTEKANGKELNFVVPGYEYYQGKDTYVSGSQPIVYSGTGITTATYLSENDGVSFSDIAADPVTSKSLGANKRIYYKTVITNSGSTAQNVSLYIKNFKPANTQGANICVGTNVPVKSFKNYSLYGVTIPEPTRNQSNGDKKRVYFEPYGRVPGQSNSNSLSSIYGDHLRTWRENPTSYWVCSGTGNTDIDANEGSAGLWQQMFQTPNYPGIYWIDIPWDHNKLYFAVDAWGGASYKRTQTFSNLSGDGLSMTQSLLFYTTGSYTSDYNNAYAGKEYCTGASFAHYFSSATISYNASVAQTQDLSLGSEDYQGTLSYSKTGSGFNLNTSTGVITSTGTGTGTVKYTVTSYYGDTKELSCTVIAKTIDNSTATIKSAPIVMNLVIPANGSQDVYWFIQNGDEMYGKATAAGTYTHSGIFVGP